MDNKLEKLKENLITLEKLEKIQEKLNYFRQQERNKARAKANKARQQIRDLENKIFLQSLTLKN